MSNVIKVDFKKDKLEKYQAKFDHTDLVLVICILSLLLLPVVLCLSQN